MQTASNRSRRNTEHERDLGLTQLFPCNEEENLTLVVGETLKGLFQLRPACLGVELLIEFGPRIAYRSRDSRCQPRGGTPVSAEDVASYAVEPGSCVGPGVVVGGACPKRLDPDLAEKVVCLSALPPVGSDTGGWQRRDAR